ncbi:SpoIVB peptidase [Pelosinus sp. sgz500959]|uniref:SpoIVB peptidase n=1 Tax=Pelosinus sp. sgz500959 TaxID=3242472 RepID=UPI00366D8587
MVKMKYRSILGVCIAALIITFCFSPQFRTIYGLPPHMRIIEGEIASFDVNFPLTLTIKSDLEQSIRTQSPITMSGLSRPVFLETVKLGNATMEFKLLNFIPIRTVQVDVLPAIKLLPGGNSIGVVLHSRGVIVVGNSPITIENEQQVNPAKDAGIHVGDVILSINGVQVQNDSQVAEVIDNSGRDDEILDIVLKRGEEEMNIKLKPVLCSETKRYRIGLFVRDSAAGVGTLTFHDPESHAYGALGHIITDSDTNQPIDCEQGKIVGAKVSGIQHGMRGQPGEKIGVFIEGDQLLGNIEKNTKFGIYGKLTTEIPNDLYSEPIPVASMNQIQTGSAEILTVVNGQTIERFSIEIQKVNLQESPEGKGIVIKVTDPILLEKTGGIVQGMSGSPIIQNGKLVGAVTHVFVHDPTRGYGCFIDWMLMEIGVIPKNENKIVKKMFNLSNRFTFIKGA